MAPVARQGITSSMDRSLTDIPDDPVLRSSAPPDTAGRDVLIAAGAGLVTVLVGARFNVGERLLHSLSGSETLQLDEWPLAMLVTVVALLWLVARRARMTVYALAKAESGERLLAAALTENRQLAREYVRVQETERRLVARELHDELGQYLTAVKLAAIALRSSGAGRPPREAEAIESIVRNTDHVTSVISSLIRKLRPVALDALGLAAALEHCVGEWRARLPEMSIGLECAGGLEGLDEELNLTVYRLVQESLTNVMKHAEATRVAITVGNAGGVVRVVVVNDGPAVVGPGRSGGFGLSGMRERAASLGGTLNAGPGQDGGYRVEARLPVGRGGEVH